jgi:PAS domain-containing protein
MGYFQDAGDRAAKKCQQTSGRHSMRMDTPLIDRIYESCFVPEFWPEVLDALGRIGGAPGASLFVLKNDAQYCITSPEPRERAQRLIKEGWLTRGRIISRLFAQRHCGFLIDVDFFTPEELEQEPIYRDVWRPQGVGWGMATAIPIPTGERAMFVLSRRTEYGPFERAAAQRLDELRPHLARSVLISARLQLERARVASEALAAMGIPALVLDEAGKVLAANSLIEAMSCFLHWRAYDRVSLQDHIADHLLRDAIAAIDADIGSSVRSFPIRDAHAKRNDGRAYHSGSPVGARHLPALRHRLGDDAGDAAAGAAGRARAILV